MPANAHTHVSEPKGDRPYGKPGYKAHPSDEVRTGALTDMTATHRQGRHKEAMRVMRYGRYPDSPLPPSFTPPSLATEIPRNPNLSLSKPGLISNAPSPITPGTKAPVPGVEGPAAGCPFARHPSPCPAQPCPGHHSFSPWGGSVMGCADYAAALTCCNYRLNCWEAKSRLVVYLATWAGKIDRYCWGQLHHSPSQAHAGPAPRQRPRPRAA